MEDTFHLGIKAVIRNNKGEVLLLKVNPASLKSGQKDYWDLPGGRVQKGHSVDETLQREVQEETGIAEVTDIKELGMVLSNLRIPTGRGRSVGLILGVYTCVARAEAPIALSSEHIKYAWFPPKKVAELLAIKYPGHFCELVAAL